VVTCDTIFSVSSFFLQSLKASERRELASRCRIEIFNRDGVLAREGDCEETQGRAMRHMYVLVQGDLAVTKMVANAPGSDLIAVRAASGASDVSTMSDDVVSRAAAEANRMEEKQWGKQLAVVNKPGSLFGERQLLFGDPWPVTVRGLTSVGESHKCLHCFAHLWHRLCSGRAH
jgi:hypothetical protein